MAAPSTKVTTTTVAGALAYIVAELAQRAGLLATVDPVVLEALQVVIAAVLALVAGYLVPESRPSPSAVALVNQRNGWRDAEGNPHYDASAAPLTPLASATAGSFQVLATEYGDDETRTSADPNVAGPATYLEPREYGGGWQKVVRNTREEFYRVEPTED